MATERFALRADANINGKQHRPRPSRKGNAYRDSHNTRNSIQRHRSRQTHNSLTPKPFHRSQLLHSQQEWDQMHGEAAFTMANQQRKIVRKLSTPIALHLFAKRNKRSDCTLQLRSYIFPQTLVSSARSCSKNKILAEHKPRTSRPRPAMKILQ